MSGTKAKATGKQVTKGGAGKVSAEKVAPDVASNVPGPELSLALPGHYIPVGAGAISVMTPLQALSTGDETRLPPAGPATDDVQVLSVRAKSRRGFWRCGRFWPHETVHIFVSDDPDGDNEANALDGDVVISCFISHATAQRLKAEPGLIVTDVPVVAEKG
ncbi:hypothetical protein [Mangrovibacter phragmitis]|uniref:hypothetical protein n=1 Tax=Mangrovibacter phragmitis TaxID=1691903 RepID=UPI00336A1FCE